MSPSTDRRMGALTVLCAMSLMIVLDSTIVAVAVPDIQRDLGFTDAGVSWVVNGYLVAFAGLLLLAGRLGDLAGAWRVFLAGLTLFTAASLLCGSATTAGLLIAGRFVQGAGGALAAAVVIGMIVRLFPEPAAQARAMGIYSFTQAGGAAAGFVLGGLLTDALGWPVIFLINVPIGVAVYLFGRRLLPRETGPGLGRGLDVPGALLITAGLSLGVYAIVGSSVAAAAAAVLLIAGFLLRQRLARHPLIPLRILSRRRLLIASAAVVLVFATGMGFQFMNALFVQRVMGYDALGTGLAFLPTPIVIGLVSLFAAPRLTGRFGPRPVLMAGLTVLVGGLLLLWRAPVAPSYVADMLPGLIIMGLGIGVTIPSIIMLAMSGAAPADTGAASGFVNTAQQAGGALGLSVLAALAADRTGSSSSVAALHAGYTLAFLVAAGFVLAALLITAILLRRDQDPTAPVRHVETTTAQA
ncbi:MFS transporter [Paractinoplanes abujensis]|uniref:EmrB/QacA subfamily drug resistance transporter n=1 Tax=Paractinoplanes abujensis TaxID=882441 RepID=A0A7W7CTG6_9ACTN|nr:MFS transporter [Actinoplanes abujensis]MBB4694367.1 EmrB/QacA subfamily drug resistance transporter [Actinoplanes abujensis]GID20419.1 MFS transporter [Actinoplanes abujensis]